MNPRLCVLSSFLMAFQLAAYPATTQAGASQQESTYPASKTVRIYVTDSQSWEVRGQWAASGGSGSGYTAGGARPQTAEIIKTFGERCPDLTVTNNKDKANYAVILDHEGGKALASRHNKIAVFNRDGDSIFSHSTVSLGNSVKDACEAIRMDVQNHPQSLIIPVSVPPTPTASSSPAPPAAPGEGMGTVSVSSTPDGADIYVDGDFTGNAPAALKLRLGKHRIGAKMSGYQDWEREMVVSAGTVNLNAKLIAGSSSSASRPAGSGSALQAFTSSPTLARRNPNTVNPDSQPEAKSGAEQNVSSGWIGMTTKDDVGGVIVTRVLPDSTASQAGLQVGDTIVELNGKPVKSAMSFDVAITRSTPGSEVRIAFMRGAWKMEVKVTVGKIV